jgi:phage replication-related protein YjqB (UPF0714/DUF867 family)
LVVAKLGKWAYYVFEGRLPSDNYRRLHITSTGFDEPGLLELLPQIRFELSFHGARRRCPLVYLGGLFEEGRETLIASLNKELPRMGLAVIDATIEIRDEEIAGCSPQNTTSRGRLGHGIELEFAATARDALLESDTKQSGGKESRTCNFWPRAFIVRSVD